jgi:hypothetical protein
MMIATPQLTGGAAGRAVLSFFRDRRRARAADGSLPPPPPDLSDRVGRPERNWWWRPRARGRHAVGRTAAA